MSGRYLQDLLYLRHVELAVHGGHGARDAAHGLRHRVLRLEGLDLERHGLDVGLHQHELAHVAPRAHQVLRHYLHCILLNTLMLTNTSAAATFCLRIDKIITNSENVYALVNIPIYI